MNKLLVILLVLGGTILLIFLFTRENNIPMDTNEIENTNLSTKTQIEKRYKELLNTEGLHRATFAGGCFWCMEGPFEQIEGVVEVVSGYSGGNIENPDYDEVVSGTTGHRESVEIFFDPKLVDFEKLLETFWWQIDPTDPNGQFADKGFQYTTAIFFHNESQKLSAEKAINVLNTSGKYEKPIATKVVEFKNFYPAEDYHQDFYKHSTERYKIYKNLSGREGYIKKQKPLNSN
ncbi:peptide-methionine (S)-S-oxide reductase MsrA [Patescibacteria group bacterium]